MIIKKILMGFAAFGLLALSPTSFSKAGDVDSYDDEAVFFLKGFYDGGFVGNIAEIDSAKKASGGTEEYVPGYDFNALGGGGALGYSFSGMRVEGEAFMSSEIKTSSGKDTFFVGTNTYKNPGFKYINIMLNANYDFALSDEITPYVGAGAGASYATYLKDSTADAAKGNSADLSSWHFSLQGKAGVMLNMSKSFVPYVGYRLFFMMNKEYGDINTSDSNDTQKKLKLKIRHLLHNIEAGVMIPIVA